MERRYTVTELCSVRNRMGESPLWSAQEQVLYWVDIEGRRLHCFDWVGMRERHWELPERIGCIALHAQGGLVAGMETGLYRLKPLAAGDIDIRLLQPVLFSQPDMRFNDGRCDRSGRFWVTSMVMDMSLGLSAGMLWRFDARGLVPVVSGLITGNGTAFSPDGRTLYLSDSHPSVRRVWTFEIDADGKPRHRRTFVDMAQYHGRPDGSAVDAEGGYWICANDAGKVHRFLPDGRLDRSIPLPISKPAMCSFGGPDMDYLFITSMPPATPVGGYDAALDGAVLVTRPGVRGIAETPFQF